jgi:hypothetical protein
MISPELLFVYMFKTFPKLFLYLPVCVSERKWFLWESSTAMRTMYSKWLYSKMSLSDIGKLVMALHSIKLNSQAILIKKLG